MSSQSRQAPRARPALLVFVTAVAALALALAVVTWARGPRPPVAPLVLLSLMGALSYNVRASYTTRAKVSLSFLSIIVLTSTALLGPFGALVVGIVSVATDPRRVSWLPRLFNASMNGIMGAAGGFAYLWAGGELVGPATGGGEALVTQVGLPLMGADVVLCLVNAVLLAAILRIQQGAPFLVVTSRILATSGLAYIGYGVIGFLFVVLWYPAGLGAFSALLILAPLLSARWAFLQYDLEARAHERTVDTLVTALETKEPSAGARSRRVAQLAEWIAQEMALGPHQIATVRYSAMLHDIGRLALPTRLVRRDPSTLSPAERELAGSHPVVGARLLDGIDFLKDAQSALEYQLEWFDGSGPAGVAGQDIPLGARIIAVATHFEASTAPAERAGLGRTADALAEIERSSGTRFDPEVVDALRAATSRHTWPAGSPVGVRA